MSHHRRTSRSAPSRSNVLAAAAAALLLVAVVLVLLRPWGDHHPARPSTGGPGSATASAPEGGAASALAGTSSGSPTSKQADEGGTALGTPSQLDRYVLRGSDLPAGWRTLDSAGGAISTLLGGCLRSALSTTLPHTESTASYRSGSDGPVLSTTVRSFTSAADARRATGATGAAIARCGSSGAGPQPHPSSPSTGAAQTVATTFTLTHAGSAARGELIVSRVGARTVSVVLVGLDDADLAVGLRAVRTVVARLR